ncbi:winged helix-turn-helix domain-containing protein [Falsiroseomonas sp.]|uniref:winged helix-turn-helix domain-containing protein n=1 Tax=Falsiroseomonas sp. TaxID=2870721 RepID=UPI003568FCEB
MAQGASRIAVVEDEADLREVIVEYLHAQGFAALPCADGAALDAALAEAPLEAVLLDLNLPREGGLSIARRLRALPAPPGILMVTALGEATDRVVGLELGADDYIGKPFELRELLARLRSVLRRRRARGVAAAPPATRPAPAPEETRFAGYRLLPAERRLLDRDGAEVPLTPMEFDLLQHLAEHPGQVLTRERLLRLSHGKPADPFDRSVDIRITRLRRKLEADPANPRLIRTVRGQGYTFAPDD